MGISSRLSLPFAALLMLTAGCGGRAEIRETLLKKPSIAVVWSGARAAVNRVGQGGAMGSGTYKRLDADGNEVGVSENLDHQPLGGPFKSLLAPVVEAFKEEGLGSSVSVYEDVPMTTASFLGSALPVPDYAKLNAELIVSVSVEAAYQESCRTELISASMAGSLNEVKPPCTYVPELAARIAFTHVREGKWVPAGAAKNVGAVKSEPVSSPGSYLSLEELRGRTAPESSIDALKGQMKQKTGALLKGIMTAKS